MEDKILKFKTGILHIKVNAYGDELLLDSTKISTFNKFAAMYGNVQKIADDAESEVKQIQQKYKEVNVTNVENVNIEAITELTNANIKYIQMILNELDGVFGEGFAKKVYRENYELDPDFVPDELSVTELIEALIPIMEDAYGERIKRTKSKYSAAKRGKHTKTKEELIQGYMGKSGAGE